MLRFRDLGASFSSFGCFVFEFWVLRFRSRVLRFRDLGVFVFDLECFVFEFWVLRFRVLGASVSSFRVLPFRVFGCFVFDLGVFVFECFAFESTLNESGTVVSAQPTAYM